MDDSAASPLAVILTVTLLAAAVAGVIVYAFTSGEEPVWDVDADATRQAFLVVAAPKEASWGDLGVQLFNSGGTDRAALYLEVPEGRVEEGQVLELVNDPPAGTYLLRILQGGEEVARATLVL